MYVDTSTPDTYETRADVAYSLSTSHYRGTDRPTCTPIQQSLAHHSSKHIQVCQLRYLLFLFLRRFKFAGTQIRYIGLTTLPPSLADCLEILGPSPS
jgi:hypothetical protein